MKVPRRSLTFWVGSSLLSIVIAGWLASQHWPTPPLPEIEAPARNVLSGVDSIELMQPSLAQLRWQDIPATAAGAASSAGLRRELMQLNPREDAPQLTYLQGLLLLADSRPLDALAAFKRIPTDSMPPTHLYAPYRLHQALHRDQPNPYLEPLSIARKAGELSPLISARSAAVEGDLEASLRSYLATDPAKWARLDLTAFQLLRLHGGLSRDTRAMLTASLRGGRVPQRLRASIHKLVSSAQPPFPSALREQLGNLLRNNPSARNLAVAAATEQLRARQLFLTRRYDELIRTYHETKPMSIPDGTLVLIVLSAIQEQDTVLRDLWAQELRRRHPEPAVAEWLARISKGVS